MARLNLFPELGTIPARPFIKWAGGKGQLLLELTRRLPHTFRRYHEPFLGGGALFFHLAGMQRLRHGAVLSDLNRELIDTYRAVRDHATDLIAALQDHAPHRHDPEYFREVRSWDRRPDFWERPLVARAARTIFLNRTCYNGLYRLNNKGQFNAPFGDYANPLICDPDNLRAASAALEHVALEVSDFGAVLGRAEPGDLIYLDPPYVPLSATASFTHYTGQTFNAADQRRVAEIFAALAERGSLVMLSNSNTELVRELFAEQPFAQTTSVVLASRKINCNGSKRGTVEELIVCSYPLPTIWK